MSAKQSDSRRGISLIELNARVSGNKAFTAALGKIDPDLNHYCCAVMAQTFPQVFKAEKVGKPRHLALLKDIYFTTAALSMRHIDETGLTAAIGKLAHHLQDFNFEENAVNLAFDHAYLTNTLKIPDEKAKHLWPFVDRHKAEIIKTMSRPGFSLESTVEEAKKLFDAPGGVEWEHLSPGFWRRMAGYALGCANVGLAVGTASLGTPLAVASVVTGAAAVAAG